MKTKKSTLVLWFFVITALGSSCKKEKQNSDPSPPPPVNSGEVVTTFKLTLTDSSTNVSTTYMFKDPDGAGGQAAFYGPDAGSQTDSVVVLLTNTTYFGKIVLLDESKNPVDSISNEVLEEGADHMFFYNGANNTVVQATPLYIVKLQGPNIHITYTDLDEGTPPRAIGLSTRWRTAASTGGLKYLLNAALKHQPDTKDGTYGPGDTDISVNFKVQVN